MILGAARSGAGHRRRAAALLGARLEPRAPTRVRLLGSGAPAAAPAADTASELLRMNEELAGLFGDPVAQLEWTMSEFNGRLAMSTSFGIQSAVLLHLATRVKPDIPVIWVDTGYLPVETYKYAHELSETLGLNLHVASNVRWTPARMEAIHGKLWEQEDAAAHSLYGKLRKVEPLNQELALLKPNPLVLLSGLRANQTKARAGMLPIGFSQGRFKLLPLLKMSDDEVLKYMDKHDLPAHPLQAKGYVTVGDWHSSRPVQEGEDPRNTRFGGKFQECGLHVDSQEPGASTAAPAGSKAEQEALAAGRARAEEEQLQPESLEKTRVKALALTRHNKDTGVAVIMVKKLTEDRSFCRKCLDVSEKIEQDNLKDWIGAQVVADVLDNKSDGALLAAHFNVATAPFFLVRDKEAENARGEWTVVRSYLQLRNQLVKHHEHVLQQKEHKNEDPMETDPALRKTALELDKARLSMEKMQIDLHERVAELHRLEKQLKERKHALGMD
jgi:phosphoadenosine phosphosulfate reductase